MGPRKTPLVQFDAIDPTLLTRWMGRVPRRIRKAMHQRLYHLSHKDRLNAAAKRYYRDHRPEQLAKAKARYERERELRKAEAARRYHANVRASRAALRARYAANPEKYRAAQRERERKKNLATAILVEALRWLEAYTHSPVRSC